MSEGPLAQTPDKARNKSMILHHKYSDLYLLYRQYLLYRFEDISFLTPLKSSKPVVMHSYICLLCTLKNFRCIHSLMLYDVVISGETSRFRKLLNASESYKLSDKPNFFPEILFAHSLLKSAFVKHDHGLDSW